MSDRPDLMLHGRELSDEELKAYIDGLKEGEEVIEVGRNGMKGQTGVVVMRPHPTHPENGEVKCVKWHMEDGVMSTSVTAGTRRISDVPESERPKKLKVDTSYPDLAARARKELRNTVVTLEFRPHAELKHAIEVYTKNGTKVGRIYPEVDGYHVFWPQGRDGFWEAPYLRMIAEKLDELNAEWHACVMSMPQLGDDDG